MQGRAFPYQYQYCLKIYCTKVQHYFDLKNSLLKNIKKINIDFLALSSSF
jgi:hypothetical protein